MPARGERVARGRRRSSPAPCASARRRSTIRTAPTTIAQTNASTVIERAPLRWPCEPPQVAGARGRRGLGHLGVTARVAGRRRTRARSSAGRRSAVAGVPRLSPVARPLGRPPVVRSVCADTLPGALPAGAATRDPGHQQADLLGGRARRRPRRRSARGTSPRSGRPARGPRPARWRPAPRRCRGRARRTMRRCTNSIEPTSSPRVGWATISSFSGRDSSRASTTFCWLPPESVDAAAARRRRADVELRHPLGRRCARWPPGSARALTRTAACRYRSSTRFSATEKAPTSPSCSRSSGT